MKKNLNPLHLVVFVFAIGFTNLMPAVTVFATEKFNLSHEVRADQTLHIKTQTQYLGSIIIDQFDNDKDAKVIPLDVRSKVNFDQRISGNSSSSPQAIRYYEQAAALIRVNQAKKEIDLRENNRIVLARMKTEKNGDHRFQIAGIGNTLRQKEYELLKNPGDPLSYTGLFDKQQVKIGDKWKLGKDQLCNLLAMNRVISTSATMMLKSVENNLAKIYIYGTVKGEVDDAITQQKIKGIAQLDLTQKRVVAMRLSIDEERRTGHVAPGFEGKIKFDARIEPTDDNILLNKERLAELHKGQKIKFNFLFDRPDCEIQFLHDTQWRVIASEKDAAILRYMVDGQLIAQCNVVQLPSRPANTPMKLSQFQEDVAKIVAESDARIVDADQIAIDSGLNALKVLVDGRESGIPFQWIYYHIENNDGRRSTFVFTLEKDAADYFGNADQELVQNVYFKQPLVAQANPVGPTR